MIFIDPCKVAPPRPPTRNEKQISPIAIAWRWLFSRWRCSTQKSTLSSHSAGYRGMAEL